MVWNQFADFIDLDPDPDSSNFVDPDSATINSDPHHWAFGMSGVYKKTHNTVNLSLILYLTFFAYLELTMTVSAARPHFPYSQANRR